MRHIRTTACMVGFAVLCVVLCVFRADAADEPSAPSPPVTNHSPLAVGDGGPAAIPYGVCSHLTWQEFPGRGKTFALASVAGIGIVRCDFPWPDHERRRGEWTFTKTDTIVADAKAAGITILPILDYWHGGYPKRFGDLGPWARHVRRVAEQYAADIPVFEIWNEQDSQPKDLVGNPTNYVAVLKAAFDNADALHETDVRGPLGADAGMAWALGRNGPMRVRFTSDAMRFFDYLGKEIWPTASGDGVYEIAVSDKPVFFVGGEPVFLQSP